MVTASQLVRIAGAMKAAAVRHVEAEDRQNVKPTIANILWLLGDEIEREFTEEADRERHVAGISHG